MELPEVPSPALCGSGDVCSSNIAIICEIHNTVQMRMEAGKKYLEMWVGFNLASTNVHSKTTIRNAS